MNWNKALPLFLSTLPCCFLHCAVSLSGGNACTLIVRGKKRLTSTIPQHAACMQTPVMIFYWRLLGGNVTGRLFWVYFFFFSFVCFSLLPLLSQSPFPQVLVPRLADRRIVLPRDINYSLFFVNSFPNQMLVHHILVIKQITSGAAEHRNTNFVWFFLLIYGRQKWHWCYWNQSQQAQTYNCVSLSRTFQTLK